VAPFTSDPSHELPPERVKEMLDDGEIELVDVREEYEWDAGRIAGARHIELERLAGRAEELPRDRPIVFQCRLGARSAMATEAFRASGWEAYNMAGGIAAWVERGLPIEPQGGRVAEH
jgi:rhodanese-related sulfurtransferase